MGLTEPYSTTFQYNITGRAPPVTLPYNCAESAREPAAEARNAVGANRRHSLYLRVPLSLNSIYHRQYIT